MKASQNNLAFVLVRPLFLGNIGAAARVLKNFGFDNLRLVQPPRNYKDAEARQMAAGAFAVLKHAQVFADLSAALADISLAVGTSAGQQRAVALEPLSAAVAPAIKASQKNKVAFVFGDERDGLTSQELLRCHRVVTLPASPDYPSLNLAQAVCVIAYELVRSEAPAGKTAICPTGQQDDALFEQLGVLLDRVNFTRRYNREVVIRELRAAYQRMSASQREHDLLAGALRRINEHLNNK